MRNDLKNTPTTLIPMILDILGEIDLDPCSNVDSIIPARVSYLKHQDGLSLPWFGKVYCNPPWGWDSDTSGITILEWILKGYNEISMRNCKQVLFLLPFKPKSNWWKTIAPHVIKIIPPFESKYIYWINKDGSKGEPVTVCFVLIENL
jgi:hypothetical protein